MSYIILQHIIVYHIILHWMLALVLIAAREMRTSVTRMLPRLCNTQVTTVVVFLVLVSCSWFCLFTASEQFLSWQTNLGELTP